MSVYAQRVREAMAGAIDVGKLAEAWLALHPELTKEVMPSAPDDLRREPQHRSSSGLRVSGAGQVVKAINPILSAFLSRAATAISDALKGVLTRLWTEGWVLGNRSALALVDAMNPDWGGWTPGDYAAAQQIAGVGLRDLLNEYGIRIKSIAESRLEELSAVLEETLRSDAIRRTPGTEPLPPFLSVADLAKRLEAVLDNPANAELVAQAEIARAQVAAATQVYAESGRSMIDVSTAADSHVCPICQALEDGNPHPLGSVILPAHPRCRCAPIPVLEPA